MATLARGTRPNQPGFVWSFGSRAGRVLFRGLVLGTLALPHLPVACASPRSPAPGALPTLGTLAAPGGAGSGSLLPHPAFALADASARVSIADIAERVTPSVVSVSSERTRRGPAGLDHPLLPDFMRPGPQKEQGLGSGVIVTADGVVLTNHHVVADASEIRVTTSDGRQFEAQLVGADEKSDLAVLRLAGEPKDLRPLPFGDSSRLRLGDVVLAVGNPFGVGQTVTMGIVSAKGRADVGITAYEDFIQTDAAINPGNSGGALVDMEGSLVGINTAILSRSGGYQGIGFAIPTNMVRPIMDSLLQHGRVVRGYLGVGIQDLDHELREAMKLGDVEGVLISSVEPGGAAEVAGIARGDVVLSVDGEKVDTTGRLRNAIAAKGAGGAVTLKVLRAGQERTFSVKLGELPEQRAAMPPSAGKEPGGIGVQLAELTPALAQRFGLERRAGVVITEVLRGSPAAQAGLRPGDVVLEVNQTPIASPADVKKRVEQEKGPLVVLIEREGRSRYVAVKR